MSELSGPADHSLMRVSDSDRERAADVLREAAGLPGPAQAPSAVQPAMAGRIGGTPRSKFSVAIMSGARRMGRWVVPRNYVGVAVMGGIELDLREAQFSEPEVTIHAYTCMGGIEITVPEDVDVDVSGFAFMGGFDHNASGPGVPGAPRVRILGFALMGGVDVRRKPQKAIKDAPVDRQLDQP